MINVTKKDVFKSRFSGKNVDFGVLSPDPKDYEAIINAMVEIGLLIPQELVEGTYKVNANFQYDTLTEDKEILELDYEIGNVIGLSKSGNFVFEDRRGDLFVAEMNAQAEAEKEDEKEDYKEKRVFARIQRAVGLRG